MHHHQSFVPQEQPKGQRQRVNLKATINMGEYDIPSAFGDYNYFPLYFQL
jgi:hypothetical protein